MTWTLAARSARMNPSVIREILKLTERPGVLSMAGGLPSPDGFPVEALREASERVLREAPREALQYAASEGYGPLREWIAARLGARGLQVDAARVLVTSGSQQGLDLLGKLLLDAGSTVAVEAPSYLGALQAFAPAEPRFVALEGDDEGPRPEAIAALADAPEPARFAYLLPNFQNPTGRLMGAERRAALVRAAQAARLPLVEDDPYGELWFDAAPPASISSLWPEGSVYLGSFSKILAPGLRLGYVVAPSALMPKLLQAKQAADLHTSGFVQRIAFEAVKDGLLERHLPAVRQRYAAQRDAMAAALQRHLPPGCAWQTPRGGMFFWLRLPAGLDAMALLPRAVEAGVAFVPGAPFFAGEPGEAERRCLRLSFVTLAPARIEEGVAALGRVLHEAIALPRAA
ncbi:MAG TPA: PLP-dependent aminotransferase family protein [Methylibium sp.]|uniref:aminotransferase-like domain-containing protein n=1 Tax=Methylibium sp. TaxID=2067992 RepID=UPI002DB7825F|nr:PLP-dependent aminotransferase family protein [Methylibium sp.]HEU4458989.1 PLP-dependent aminotransferase family protein [Methylibium sp.]